MGTTFGRGLRTVLLALATAAACGGPGAYEQELGTNGGTVSTPDGVTINVPEGATSAPITISVTPAPDAPVPAGAVQVGNAYTFGPEGTQFDVPVRVTLPFDPSKLPIGVTESSLVVYTAPAGSSAYTVLPTGIADSTHVWANTPHFSTFLVGTAAQGGGGGGGGSDGGCCPTCDCASIQDGGHGGGADSGPVGCVTDANCPSGTYCVNGACSAGVDSGPACTVCGGVCTFLTNDPNNCGACGNACPSGSSCSAGYCNAGASDAGIGDGGISDGGGWSDGGGPPPPDGGRGDGGIQDAGYPDAGPSDGGIADGGACTLCGGACVDLMSDPSNCGACGMACPSGQSCTYGTCG